MHNYLLLALTYFIFIGLRAFQQINVQERKRTFVIPTSMLMAAVEVYALTSLVKLGYGLATVVAYGTSAGLGSLTAMYIHDKYNDYKEKKTKAIQASAERSGEGN